MKSPGGAPSGAVIFKRSRPRSSAGKVGAPLSALSLLLACSLACCAAYRPQPLDAKFTLKDRVPELPIDPRRMQLPELAAHKFDPSDGLDMTEVAMVAVVNNPDLKIARADAGIAHAPAFAAGLLPDPQITLTRDFPDAVVTADYRAPTTLA